MSASKESSSLTWDHCSCLTNCLLPTTWPAFNKDSEKLIYSWGFLWVALTCWLVALVFGYKLPLSYAVFRIKSSAVLVSPLLYCHSLSLGSNFPSLVFSNRKHDWVHDRATLGREFLFFWKVDTDLLVLNIPWWEFCSPEPQGMQILPTTVIYNNPNNIV